MRRNVLQFLRGQEYQCVQLYNCSWADYSNKKCKFYYSGGDNTTLRYNCDSKLLNVSDYAPTYPSLNFFHLMFFFLKSLYDLYYYNEIFADFMLTSATLVEEHFPHAHKLYIIYIFHSIALMRVQAHQSHVRVRRVEGLRVSV